MDAGAGLLGDERTDVHPVLGAVPDRQGAHALGEPAGELLGDRLVHQEPVGRGAGLADVAHLGQHRAVDGGVEVGVLEDEEGRVAAELHRHPQQLVGGLGDELLADRRRAGEGELAQARVLDDRLADAAGVGGGDDVEHAGRQADLLEQRGEGEHRQGVSAAGLTTIVQPAAMAGPILRVPIASGKFQGVIIRVGPTGPSW